LGKREVTPKTPTRKGGRRGFVNHREELTAEADYVDEGLVLE
jgi:hypothetical protein